MEKLCLWRLQYRAGKCWDEAEQTEFRLNFKRSEIRNSQSRKTSMCDVRSEAQD